MTNDVSELLSILKIHEDIANVTLANVNRAFRKQAKLLHPDKAGDSKTEAFKQLLEAYDKLKLHFSDSPDNLNDTDIEEKFFKANSNNPNNVWLPLV